MSDPRRPTAATEAAPRPGLFAGRSPLPVPPGWPPTLLFVIDTEEEFAWNGPRDPEARSVRNVLCLPLLQAVLDRHGVIPAYLVGHPVATDPAAVSVLREIAEDQRCEIGGHLHPWVTPPIEETMSFRNSYACNLPPALERRKLETLTTSITAAFGTAPRIFKAGAYGVGPHTAGFLAALGYRVDSSVVPFTDFSASGGPDFREWGPEPFRTVEGIVEIPLTAGFAGVLSEHGPAAFPVLERTTLRALRAPGVAARLGLLERLRLSPEGNTLSDMVRLTRAALARGERLFMLSMHSSSLLPGATEYARTEAERDALLTRIDGYLGFFHSALGGVGLRVSEAAARLEAEGST